MTQTTLRTNTPQEYFKHVGLLESQEAVASVARKMLQDECNGLVQACISQDERELLEAFSMLLSNHNTSREQWAGMKESCLMLLGSPIASCVDHLISGLRTPAIAESALRSAGMALIEANEKKTRQNSECFMRQTFREAMYEPTGEE